MNSLLKQHIRWTVIMEWFFSRKSSPKLSNEVLDRTLFDQTTRQNPRFGIFIFDFHFGFILLGYSISRFKETKAEKRKKWNQRLLIDTPWQTVRRTSQIEVMPRQETKSIAFYEQIDNLCRVSSCRHGPT